MKISLKTLPIFLLIGILLSSCEDEVVILPVPDCVTTVTYRGTNVCNDEVTAAAVELADSSLLIVSNFFDFADSSTIMIDDLVNIDYGTVDSSLFNSGVLCGVAIVAPVAEISCFAEN